MEFNASNLWQYFTENALRQKLLNDCEIAKIPANTLILDEGKYIKIIPILISGRIKVFRQEGIREILLYHINPDESCIISISSSLKNEKSQVRAVTEKDSEILMVPSRYIAEWQKHFPSFNDFILNLYKTRFDDILTAFNAIAFQKIDERLVHYLENKVSVSQNKTIHVTHQAIADELGTARETVSRLLKKLELEKKITLSRGNIEIHKNPLM